ncbi:hypothetical protein SAMN05421663_102298 [Terribacillus halophilus]|uniref:Uncharacterized protein n=1 Tax=Terribacillus halophilus TaxID=361279 RepID=A0A1G6L979_9BACI|nr:hypothetical protein [Terribacillus halophilus]SDC39637.1 hypothetical protein SAMN05421663_102298 [Terribacillus halophilus]
MKLSDELILLQASVTTEEDYGLGEIWQSIDEFMQEIEEVAEAILRMFLFMGAGFIFLIGLSYVFFSWIGAPRGQSKTEKKKFWIVNGYVLLGFLIVSVLIYVIPAAIIF